MRIKCRGAAILAVCMIAASLAASTASAEEPAPPPDPGAAPGASVLELGDLRTQAVDQGTADVMVTVDPAAGDPAVAVETALAGTTFTTGHVIDDIVAVEVDAAGLEALSASPAVASVVEDRRLELSPMAAATPSSTALHTIGADVAHAAGYDGAGTRIAIVDTGVDLTHPALLGSTDPALEACFVTSSATDPCPDDGDGDPNTAFGAGAAAPCIGDDCFSGTVVASLALGRGSPEVPIGVAPGATLIPVRIYQSDSDGSVFAQTSDLLAALAYLADIGASDPVDVVSLAVDDPTPLSSGYSCRQRADIGSSLSRLAVRRSVLVGAAGDGGSGSGTSFPTCNDAVHMVTASGPHDIHFEWANFGKSGVSAPGVATGAIPGGMGTYGGTSVAAALTVGATALLLQQNPGMLVGDEGRDRNAIRLAFQTGWIPTHGSPFRGRIDIAASLGLRPRGVYGAFAIHRKGYIDELGDAPYGAGVGHRIIVGGALVPTLGGSFRGHWVADVDGRVFALEGAPHFGDMEGTRLNEPIIAMAATPTGGGYWLLAEDGGIFSFGDAAFYGSTGNMRLNAPVTDIAATPSGRGYWLTAMDGGVFSFGDAQFYGSTGNIRINEPVVSMDATSSGNGYWLVALDGGIFGFGDAQFYGSLPGIDVTEETGYRIRAIPDGHGYYIATLEGGVYPFGEATFFGHAEYPTDPNNPVLDLILVTG